MDHKWKYVEGKTPSKRELVDWTEQHWMSFLQFCMFFISGEGENQKLSVTKQRWRETEGLLAMPNHPFEEFLYRVNKFPTDPGASEKRFFGKFSSMMRFCLGYLKNNPSKVTPTMRKFIEPNQRLNWCLTQTKIVPTDLGVDVVTLDPQDRSTQPFQNQPVATYEKQLTDSMLKTANLLNLLVDSIKPEEINKMPVKDRLAAIARMSYVYSIGKSFKPGKQIFKQLNIHAANREDLEKAVLAFAQPTPDEL